MTSAATVLYGPAQFHADPMVSGSAYGTMMSWEEVANATGYEVYRETVLATTSSAGLPVIGPPPRVVGVLDLTSAYGRGGTRVAFDPLVYPGMTYRYWVKAVLSNGSTSVTSRVASVTVPSVPVTLWVPNLRATVSGTTTVTVTNLAPGTPLSGSGGSATMAGSNVTWVWDAASLVFGYEIEWSIVENGATLVFGRERVEADRSGLPSLLVAPVTKGVPAGKSVRFCIAFYANTDPTKPLDPNSGHCLTTVAPAGPPAGTIVEGAPIGRRPTTSPTVMSNGPAPAALVVRGSGLTADVSWSPPIGTSPGAFTYTVNRAVAGTTSWTLLTTAPITATSLVRDILPDRTRSYTYQVRAIGPNGTFGTADASYTPPAPSDPGDFAAAQVADGEVALSWTAVAGVSRYLISGPGTGTGLTLSGSVDLNRQHHKLTGIPVGSHSWTIASVYEPGGVLTARPDWPTAAATVVALSGRYRVSMLGFDVRQATHQDRDSDGRGDEVYLAAVVTVVNRTSNAVIAEGTTRSVIYGDVANRPRRTMAGTLTPEGGLKTGDAYPLSGGGSWPVVNPAREHLPMLLWEGTLTVGGDVALVQPSIWESDEGVAGFGFSGDEPFAKWSGPASAAVPAMLASAPVQAEIAASGIRAFTGHLLGFSSSDSFDHPIGLRDATDGVFQGILHQPVVVLTREKIESVLSAVQVFGGLAPGTIAMTFFDSYARGYAGQYTIYLRVERVP